MMKTFKDNQKQTWQINLTLQKVRSLREKLGLDLLNPQHYMQVLGSLTDRLAFVFLLVEDEAKKLGIDIDAFESRLYGDGVAQEVGIAFLAECELFFRKLGQEAMAELTKKSVASMRSGQTRLDEMMKTGQLDSLMDQADKEIQKMLPPSVGSGSPS
jgi:hypothetical protein